MDVNLKVKHFLQSEGDGCFLMNTLIFQMTIICGHRDAGE